MNKSELIDALAAETGSTKVQAAAHLDAFTNVIAKGLKAGDNIALVGFGTFSIKARKARVGRNPQNGEAVEIAAKNLPVFKAGKKLVEFVN